MKNYIALCILITSILIFATSCRPSLTQEEINQRIENEEEFRNLNKFCEDLPKPSNLSLINKRIKSNGVSYIVLNRFKSVSKFPATLSFFKNYFQENDWDIIRSYSPDEEEFNGVLTVKKGINEIWVEQMTVYEFVLSCSRDY